MIRKANPTQLKEHGVDRPDHLWNGGNKLRRDTTVRSRKNRKRIRTTHANQDGRLQFQNESSRETHISTLKVEVEPDSKAEDIAEILLSLQQVSANPSFVPVILLTFSLTSLHPSQLEKMRRLR